MRTIKFRGKSLNNGEWVVGNYIGFPTSDEGSMCSYIELDVYCVVEVDSYTVGQFTGLLDKNGKEIYEGDIIRVKTCEYDRIGRFYCKTGLPKYLNACVKYNDRSCRYDLVFEQNEYGMISCDIGWGYEEFEVIGNIHDNPELLKGEEQ